MADTTARERRMQRLKEEQRKEVPKTIAKTAGIAILAVAVVGGIGWAIFNSSTGDENCPGHWHATVGFFVEGERAVIPQPPYNFQGDSRPGQMPLSLHLHQGDMEQFHFEPSRRECVGLQEALSDIGVELRSDRVSFVDGHEGLPHAGTYRNNETHEVRLFFQMPDDERMREESFSDVRDYQLQDGERFMLVYGDHTDEELSAMMNQVRYPSGAVAEHPGSA